MPSRVFWLIIVGLLAAPAAAEPKPKVTNVTVAEARDAIAIFNEGKERQAAGDFEAAYLLFREADAQYPGALPKYRAAICLDALGRTSDAARAYRAFLDSKPEAKHAELVAMARTRLAALQTPSLFDRSGPKGPKPAERVASSVARPKVRSVEARRDVRPAPPSDRLGLRVAGFVLLGAGLAGGAAFAATFAQSRMADDDAGRENAGTAATVLAPVTAALLLSGAIVLPLGFREPDASAVITPYVGPASAGLVARF